MKASAASDKSPVPDHSDLDTSYSALKPPAISDRGQRARWLGLYGAARPLSIAASAAQESRPLVVITPDAGSAAALEGAIRFFASETTQPPEGSPSLNVFHFPDWETLPYDAFSPHQDIVSERLSVLSRLSTLARSVLIVPVTTLMCRISPRSHLAGSSWTLESGARLDQDQLRADLEQSGYRYVTQVMEHGEFAVRGSIVDLFPMGHRSPVRIDLFDDEIESIKQFNPETQRSEDVIDSLSLLPAREFPLDEEAIGRFRQRWRDRFEGNPNESVIYRDVSQGLLPSGIEYYLPLFFETTASLLDYLPQSAAVIELGDVHEAAQKYWHEIVERHEQLRYDRERPILDPTEVFHQPTDLFAALKSLPVARIDRFEDTKSAVNFATRAPTQLPIEARAEDPLAAFRQFAQSFDGNVLIAAETPGRRETLLETFRNHGLPLRQVENWKGFLEQTQNNTDPQMYVAVAPLSEGAVLESPAVALIAESQLFGQRAAQRRRRRAGRDAEAIVKDLTELQPGAPVVHEVHGVGRYIGLQTLETGGVQNEYLTLEYSDNDKLYVPVASLHLVSRFTGADPETAPLHKLGTTQWQKAREKAARQAFDVAAELLEVQARRAARPGIQYPVEDAALHNFEQAFAFEETPDQLQAIESVIDDLRSPRPMDRLVCGDVGFGKTEVALRGAFVAVNGGYQVAVLVPTTLLAQQHYQTFSDRFADWPVRVEQLSRFRSKKERDNTTSALADGTVDIVIGTHRLLQNDIRFKRLGLVIIDEEHRFGVRHKERLKALRAESDILTLTATPIPRTLNMALSGMRDLSLIATPPERRLSIKTFVREWNKPMVREAVMREIHRGGQTYFVHNKVEDIAKVANDLAELVPEATVQFAHGQMREQELERVMVDFYHQRFNVLVCTTIIETGIDVPSANTIIINRADRFGLAQLHQLRGRVGRSHHRAYAYLIVPDKRAMTADAVKRLEAIESLEDLGIGFTLATHDLEIRGAGEILGEGQSGQIHEVGYAMYTRLLERAVSALKRGEAPELDRPLDHGTEIDLRTPALIPSDYLPDVQMRLISYKRIASAEDSDELQDLKEEMIDRFGKLPEATQHLFDVTALKLLATPIGVKKIDLGPTGGRIAFSAEANIDPVKLVELIQTKPKSFALDGPQKLRIKLAIEAPSERCQVLSDLLSQLHAPQAAA